MFKNYNYDSKSEKHSFDINNMDLLINRFEYKIYILRNWNSL
jgi:hypothetical protein